MIFDAMTFALFEVTSTSRRDVGSLQSDLTFKRGWVSLIFEHLGTTYRVERELPYMYTGRIGKIMKKSPTTKLWTARELVSTAPREVDARVEEILGKNADQWRQIVMLAQGKFMNLLDTKSGERTAILRNFFGTDRYKDIQDRLVRLVKEKDAAFGSWLRKANEKLKEFKTDIVEDLTKYPRVEQERTMMLTLKSDEDEVSALNSKEDPDGDDLRGCRQRQSEGFCLRIKA